MQPEDENSNDFEGFLQSLDTAEEELELRREVGKRKIDVILHRGYEYRCDRASERARLSQRWVCRYASKTKCKGKFKLIVRDLTDFMDGATIAEAVDHNHSPIRVKTYGMADIREVHTNSSSCASHSGGDTTSTNDTSTSDRAISQLGESKLSANLNGSRVRSLSFDAEPIDWSTDISGTTPTSNADASFDLVGISQEGGSSFQAVRHVKRLKDLST